MPPVVEGRRGQHGAAAPGRDKRSQRRAKAENVYGIASVFRIAAEGGPHDDPGGTESAQHRAKLDQQMGWGPKTVTANGFMPGNVPVKPGGNTHGGNHVGPDQPRYGLRAGRDGWRAYARRSSNSAHVRAPSAKIMRC